ncbi:MAG: hypothetical protein J6Y62_02670 [Clostridia bacterium]|nr:hypothetical protein [Clostridia bacterium]
MTVSNVFVHGYMGWGSYDAQYKVMPYWGMFTGDLLKRLNKAGFACYAASVAPQGSAWDRACELYAQLAGTRTDYGAAHAALFHHDRYGPDFTGRPLVPQWDAEHPVNLLGHSFGAPTVRYLAELLVNGQRQEASYPDASPLFRGGHDDLLHAVVTLAGTNNGTTMVGPAGGTPDTAVYDMAIDHAVAVNRTMRLSPNVYYFACPCDTSVRQADGTYKMDEDKTEKAFVTTGNQMGRLSGGVTRGGVVIDETWRQNDGLVNTVAAGAPLGQPAREATLNEPAYPAGVWNVFPPYNGDHMSHMGGMLRRNKDVDRYYNELLSILARTD